MKNVINKIYHNQFFSWLFPTTVYCLRKSLRDCESVLDLGCGPSSPLQYCENIKYSVGVEIFRPYLGESKKRKIHNEYIEKKIEEIEFPEKSFDAVIMIEVLEHLSQDAGYSMLKKAEKWARKKIIVSTPNGFLPQGERDENLFQRHLSGWRLGAMGNMGYVCWGLACFRWLHKENLLKKGAADYSFLDSIRLRPKLFWFLVATLSQFLTYRFPRYAFELFCVKRL